MGCTCAPALIVARNELNALFPNRDKSSDGCCGDAAHAARKSDHNASIEGYARAYDFDEDIASNMGDRELWGMGIVLLSDRRTKYLIYEGRILYPDGTNRAYTGINAHLHHLHLSIHDWAVMDKSPWGLKRAFQTPAPQPLPSPQPPEEDDMPISLIQFQQHPDPDYRGVVWKSDGFSRWPISVDSDHLTYFKSLWGEIQLVDKQQFESLVPMDEVVVAARKILG